MVQRSSTPEIDGSSLPARVPLASSREKKDVPQHPGIPKPVSDLRRSLAGKPIGDLRTRVDSSRCDPEALMRWQRSNGAPTGCGNMPVAGPPGMRQVQLRDQPAGRRRMHTLDPWLISACSPVVCPSRAMIGRRVVADHRGTRGVDRSPRTPSAIPARTPRIRPAATRGGWLSMSTTRRRSQPDIFRWCRQCGRQRT